MNSVQMFASGFADPTLIQSYLAAVLSLYTVAAICQRLSRVDCESNRKLNRTLHQVKWVGFAACMMTIFVKATVRIWHIGTAQGPSFVDTSWWQYTWVLFVLSAAGSGGLAIYLRWADRPYPPGQCGRCGYPTQGNESGVCPECGTAIKEIR